MPNKCSPKVVLQDPGDRRQRFVWRCSCGKSNEVTWFSTEAAAKRDASKHTR
ncbi:hypothetical protein ACFYOY_13425 [Streptomyces sp. NPDC007875]|uniref:hypothetical protein n=1 Tax=Streptomyces sp. NPDC007875 TaxID=3364783 RepID=UPI0036BC400C